MIKFLLQRPIAVLMAFLSCFILGLVTYFTIPISLLPDIAIPEITVQVSGQNTSARELENTVVKPIRQQLLSIGGLRDIESETRDGAGLLRLNFEFGTNTDLAFIEVNEKVDAAMGMLPRDTERPRVVKASATDIPVFCLNLSLKSESPDSFDEPRFLELCEFAENVIRRRIEQLPEVAMVDITGIIGRQLQIIPDEKKLEMAGITLQDLEQALADNNVEPGSMKVRDGYYEYNIKFSTLMRTLDDVANIYIRKSGRIFQLKELAEVKIASEKESGASFSNGKRAVTLAIIKQSDENMNNMKKALGEVTDYFQDIYPDIEFLITRNQTELLDFTISNLKQNLSLGFLFICIVALLFLGDVKSPTVIGLSMVVSLVTSFLFFYLFNVTLNIISLSGLILALGMMIDSSIVVTENIEQFRARGDDLERACIRGTEEVITPMLSSTFTTIAVFVPLVFMSGIAGAIFFDQAFAVTVGLLVSYATGIMLLPVLYKMAYSIDPKKKNFFNLKINSPIKAHTLDRFYDKGVDFVFNHKPFWFIFILITLPLCVVFFIYMPKSRMPEIDEQELIVRIEWNENLHLEENYKRVNELSQVDDQIEHTAYVGLQQFLLNRDQELSSSEAELYFKAPTPDMIPPLQKQLEEKIRQHYPAAIVTFSPPETVFEKLFVTGEADIVAEMNTSNKERMMNPSELRKLERQLAAKTGYIPTGVSFENQLNIYIDREKLFLYNVDYYEVYRVLKTVFKENQVQMLRSYQQYLPISIVGTERTVNQVLQETLIRTNANATTGEVNYVPLQALITVTPAEDIKVITAGKNGEYIPFSFYNVKDGEKLMASVRETARDSKLWETGFSGSFFSNRKMLGELTIILMISVLLMYFILASQFESFLQPLIVLVEIPIDVCIILAVLWLTGHTLNLMSAIGIIVTCGIIINDSILKLDVINELRKVGWPLVEAIHEAGHRRLRPIIMTSLTTAFGMLPLLFTFDLGTELQKPLSIAMIIGMLAGMLVSLFLVPLVYWLIYRKHDVTPAQSRV